MAILLCLLCALGAALPGSALAVPATFTVTSAGDDTTGGCNADCTLREAIAAANANANDSETDTINFAIPGSGVQTITPASQLPVIDEPVTINGYSQPGASQNTLAVGNDAVLLIELNGQSAGNNTSGLLVGADSVTIRGLVINRFEGAGIIVFFFGGNVQIHGNFVGTDPGGTLDLGNNDDGVSLGGGAARVGGLDVGNRNLISGNAGPGINASGGGGGADIDGNYIGTDRTGSVPLGNDMSGVLSGTGAEIGDSGAIGRNVISANGANAPAHLDNGVHLDAGSSTAANNYIGTRADGTGDLGNAGFGIYDFGTNFVGLDSTNGTGNLVAGNDKGGIQLTGDSSLVRGNTVSSNGGPGVSVLSDSNYIGWVGSGVGYRNSISSNTGDGIEVTGQDNGIWENSINANGGLAIDLVATTGTAGGVTPNDPDDADSGGGNNFFNFPVITSVGGTGGNITVSGHVDAPDSTGGDILNVSLFASSECDASGNGEGAMFLGITAATWNSSADVWEFTYTGPSPHVVELVSASQSADEDEGTAALSARRRNHVITAVATGLIGPTGWNSSEFSACATSGTTSVGYGTSAGTATAGTDYTETSGTLFFPAGAATASFNVPLANDSADEPDETFDVTLSNPQQATLGSPTSSTVTIVDDDAPPVDGGSGGGGGGTGDTGGGGTGGTGGGTGDAGTPTDTAEPDSAINRIPRVVTAAQLTEFSGTASDDGTLARVDIALVRLEGGARIGARKRRCSVLRTNGRLRRVKARRGRCVSRAFLPATGTTTWGYRLKRRLPKGHYVLFARAADASGKAEQTFSAADGNLAAFRVR